MRQIIAPFKNSKRTTVYYRSKEIIFLEPKKKNSLHSKKVSRRIQHLTKMTQLLIFPTLIKSVFLHAGLNISPMQNLNTSFYLFHYSSLGMRARHASNATIILFHLFNYNTFTFTVHISLEKLITFN